MLSKNNILVFDLNELLVQDLNNAFENQLMVIEL